MSYVVTATIYFFSAGEIIRGTIEYLGTLDIKAHNTSKAHNLTPISPLETKNRSDLEASFEPLNALLTTIFSTLGISKATEAPGRPAFLPMSRLIIDEERARQVIEAVKNEENTIRSAAAKVGISPTLVANGVAGRVALAASCGPRALPTAEEDTAVEGLLAYTGRYRLASLHSSLAKTCKTCATTAAEWLGTS